MKNKRSRRTEFNRKVISLAIASCFVVSNPLYANPTGPTVVNGQATIQQAGNLLQITNSPNAIINWQSFSIGASEITRFIQQSQASAVLNRVVGAGGVVDPSVILGALQSNGRVFLVNPNGVLFGSGARIDVAGLVATSLNLSNSDFLAGRLNFTDGPGAGSILNQGNITTDAGGNVYLAGPAVANDGIIASPKGEVILAAGNSVELVSPGTPNLRVEIAASGNEAKNLGQIIADSGRIGIYAGLINHGGTLRADTVEVGRNGEILLKASRNITLEPGSVISASGAPGGVHDGGTVRIVADDTLDMLRGSAVHVDGGVDGGNGGFLELSGKQQIALNGEFTGSARKDGYKHGSLLLDPLNINIGALGVTGAITLASSAGAMVIKQDGTRVYLVRPSFALGGSDFIEVIDTTSNSIVATIDLQDFSNAAVSGMALSPDGSKLYAVFGNTGAGSGYIRVIDTSTNTVTTTYGVGGPTNLFGMAVDSSNRIYVAGNIPFSNPSTASMVVIDGDTGTELASVPVAFNPQQVFANPSGTRVYVTSTYPTLLLQEFATGTNTLLTSTPLAGRPNSNVFSADGTKLYMAYSGRIEVRDPATTGVIDTIPLGADSLALNGNTAYIARGDSASVLDLTTKTAKQSFAIGTASQGARVVFNGSNNRVFASSQSTVTVIDLNAGSDAVAGGVIAHTDAPGETLNLPVSALSGAWTNVSLAATNNVSVNAPIASSDVPAGGTLTLTAGNDVNVNAWIGMPTARFDHDLTLTAGNDINVNGSIYQGNRPLILAADANIPAQGIASNGAGNVNIKALGAPVMVDTLGSLTVTGKDFNILGGNNTSVTVNVGGLLDANVTGNFTLQGGRAVADNGDNANASVTVQANVINIAASGTITVAGGDSAEASACCNNGQTNTAVADASTTMTAATSINLTAGSGITIRGGDNAEASACCNAEGPEMTGTGTATTNASATVTAGTTLTLTAPTVTIRGGDFAEASACCNGSTGGNGAGTATVNTNATVSAGGNLAINGTTVDIRGGNSAEAFTCCNGDSGIGAGSATVNTNATVVSGQDLAINATGTVTIAGGNNASGSACCNGSDGGNGQGTVSLNANAEVGAGRHLNLTAASLAVRGGDNAEASACCNGSSGGNGTANVSVKAQGKLTSSQDMTLTVTAAPGAVTIRGGDNASASACCNGSSGGNGTAIVAADFRAVVSAGGTLSLTATSLAVRGGDNASGSACCNGSSGGNGNGTVGVNATALLSTPQNMTLNVSGPVLIRGGDYAEASACCNGSAEGNGLSNVNVDASATVSAGGTLALTAGSLEVRGGNFASASAGGVGTNTAAVNANAVLSAGGNMTLATTSGGMTVAGGDSAEAYGSSGQPRPNSATVNADATVSSGGLLTVNSAGGLTVRGGNNAYASVSSSGVNTTLVNANASLLGDTMALTVTGPVVIQGGNNALAEASCCGDSDTRNTSTVNANAQVRAANGLSLTVNGGNVTVAGGDNARTSGTEASGQYTTTTNAKGELSTTAGNLAVNVTGGTLAVRGGDSASASASASSNLAQVTSTTVATGKILAGGNLSLTAAGGMTIRGGNFASADADGTGFGTRAVASTNADGAVAAGGSISVNAPSLAVTGGNSARATVSDDGQNSATITANAFLSAGSDVALTTSGGINIGGGNSAIAQAQFGSAGGANAASASVGALVSAGGMATLNTGSLMIAGGTQSSLEAAAGNGAGVNSATTLANANVATSGDLSYTGGPVTLTGGVARAQGASGTTNTAMAEASGGIQGGGNKSFTITGDLMITGGQALDTAVAPNVGGATARAVLDPGTLDVAASGDVTITGGAVSGAGSAYAGMMATGPINLTIGGTTGLTVTGGTPGTGPVGTGVSPITVSFSGGGMLAVVDNAALDGAFVNTAVVAPPSPPVISEPPPDLPPPLNTQIHDPIFSESGQSTGASQTSDSTQQTAQTGGGDQQSSEKEEKKTIPVCR
ncbi:MAG: filamentous hemagglutinin N-terminal domain-containing protein [Betaproteobacteria bacterium]|nr:filamentous hemagglutinin N-terminal domain-containing protein [Betaproteobacteria bacterium]